MVNKELAVFINTSIETSAQETLFKQGILEELQGLIMKCNS